MVLETVAKNTVIRNGSYYTSDRVTVLDMAMRSECNNHLVHSNFFYTMGSACQA